MDSYLPQDHILAHMTGIRFSDFSEPLSITLQRTYLSLGPSMKILIYILKYKMTNVFWYSQHKTDTFSYRTKYKSDQWLLIETKYKNHKHLSIRSRIKPAYRLKYKFDYFFYNVKYKSDEFLSIGSNMKTINVFWYSQ